MMLNASHYAFFCSKPYLENIGYLRNIEYLVFLFNGPRASILLVEHLHLVNEIRLLDENVVTSSLEMRGYVKRCNEKNTVGK